MSARKNMYQRATCDKLFNYLHRFVVGDHDLCENWRTGNIYNNTIVAKIVRSGLNLLEGVIPEGMVPRRSHEGVLINFENICFYMLEKNITHRLKLSFEKC
jgi:hypothetical protein